MTYFLTYNVHKDVLVHDEKIGEGGNLHDLILLHKFIVL